MLKGGKILRCATPGNVLFTAAGVFLRDELQKVMADLERVKNQTIQLGNHTHGKLQVGCFDGVVVDDFLPQFYERTKESCPGLEINLVRGSFREMGRALDLDELDLVFTLDWACSETPGVQSKVLAARRLSLFYRAGCNGDTSVQELNSLPLLLTDDRCLEDVKDRELVILRDLGVTPSQVRRVPGISTLMACLNMGQEFAILSSESKRYLPHLNVLELPECYTANVLATWKGSNPLVRMLMEQTEE